MSTRLVALLAAVSCLPLEGGSGVLAAPVTAEPSEEAQCNAFMNALRTGNAAQLGNFGVYLDKPGVINEIDQALISTSMQKVLKQDDLQCSVTDRGENSIIRIMIYPKRVADLIRRRDLPFLKTQYYENYFACEFKVSAGRWKTVPNLCFNETEGPYEEEPDL